MPSFATFSPGLPNNVQATKSSGMAKVLPCIAGKSAQKVGAILPLSYQPLSEQFESRKVLRLHLLLYKMFDKDLSCKHQ